MLPTTVVPARLLRLAFVAYVIATAVHLGYVVAHEPFAFDAWNVAQDTHAERFTVGRWLHYGAYEYTHSNPRIGQWFAYLAYKLDDFAVIATPFVYLATALAVFVLGTARFPRWSRGRDLALYATLLGFLWFAVPRIGMLMFCRAYATNYLYAACIQLWFLVPLRLKPYGDTAVPKVIAYALFGIAAGMCNEHTGPALAGITLFHAIWRMYVKVERAPLALGGALGAIVGFAAIFFAPGQGERYDGLATQVGLGARLLQRGFTANLDIVRELVIAMSPLLVILVILLAVGRRDRDDDGARARAFEFLALALAGAALITATLFVSPKLGPRFYMHACLLVLAGVMGVADTVLTSPRRYVAVIVVALTASVYAGFRTVPLYARLAEQSDARLAALAASTPGTVFTADSYEQVDDNWWFLGDDFRDVRKRALIEHYYDLRGVIFRGVDLEAPLGLSDVRLVPHATMTPAACVADRGGFELGTFKGLDVESMVRAFRDATAALRGRVEGSGGTLDGVELAVEFAGAPPAHLPRAKLLVGRWTKTRGFDGAVAGKLARGGASTARDVVLPREVAGGDYEIVIYRVGDRAESLGPARVSEHRYKPWGAGAYWALACRTDECFLLAATRQL